MPLAQVPLELQELAQLELPAEAQRLVLVQELAQLELPAEAQESLQGAQAGS